MCLYPPCACSLRAVSRGTVSSLEVFVRDLATKIKAQAAASVASGGDGQTLTPIELCVISSCEQLSLLDSSNELVVVTSKRAVEGSNELAFLHDKVAEIDESAVKYHRTQQRKGKRAAAAATGESKRPAKKTTRKKADTKKTARRAGAGQQAQPTEPAEGAPPRTEVGINSVRSLDGTNVAIDEDDDYDESDSD